MDALIGIGVGLIAGSYYTKTQAQKLGAAK
jgi:hypothetical protein